VQGQDSNPDPMAPPFSTATATPHIFAFSQLRKRAGIPTQLYFPGEPYNATDPLFNPNLVMRVQETPEGPRATFDFILGTKR